MFARFIFWLLRIFFQLFYHQMAWTYDAVAWLVSFGKWQAWGRTALPHLQGQRILELAHGPGHLLAAMHQQDLRPVGLDLSPNMGQLAQHRLQKCGAVASLVRARAQALPFRAAAFDSVVATFPTEFILDPNTLKETARVLGEEGRLVVVPGITFNGQHKRNLPARFLEWLYTFTGQNALPLADAMAAIANLGFSLHHLQQPMGIANALIVVAKKTHSE